MSLFEFAVASEVFGPHSWMPREAQWYRTRVCSPGSQPVRLRTGVSVDVGAGLRWLASAGTVIVPPCSNPAGIAPEVLQALRRAHQRGARLVSLCTGAFVLAAAGLLDGRRATTHWADCARLAAQYPSVELDPDVLFVDEGDILTSAGSAASIDLCLHLVRQDFGAEVATSLARDLVVPPHRDGGQAQYIAAPMPDFPRVDLFAGALAWAEGHLELPITIEELARRSAMSRRTFARRFQETTGTTPYQWLLRQRLQFAQRLLETTDLAVDVIAARSGFGEAANLRKHFARTLHTSPHGYRRTFQAS